MASPNTHLVSGPQLSYDTSIKQRSLHAFRKIKARTRLFCKAGPAVRGFNIDESYNLSYLQLVKLIEAHEYDEKQLEKDVFTIEGLSCVRCTLAFSSKDHLEKHRYFCGNPNIVAGDLKTLRKHQDFLQKQDGGMLLCPWCPILCLDLAALHKHVRNCREARRERNERHILRRLPCPECTREFSHLQKLSNHMQSHYVADFICNACKLSFTSAKYLAEHLTNCRSKHYRCCDCNKTFSSTKCLRMHILTCRKSVQCLKCAEFFPGKTLCVEHIVEHIFSEWAKMGLQMLDGVLFKIMRHKLPQDNVLKPFQSSISPCVSPVSDFEKSPDRSTKSINAMVDSRPKSPLRLKYGIEIEKCSASFDKLLHRDNTGDNLPGMNSNGRSAHILTLDQETSLVKSNSTVKLKRSLKRDNVSNSRDPSLNMAHADMPSTDEDDLSVIENEVYEIEHTLDEDENCDSDLPLPTFEAGDSSRYTIDAQQTYSDVAQLFTPAVDIESGDSNKLTLTIVNVEGGANLFDWDDCNFEEDNCGATEMDEPQPEMYGSISSPAETGNDMPLGADSHSDGNEDGDSGIGATDDSDSNKDRSEVTHKCEEVSANHSEIPSELLTVPVKADNPPCPLALSEVFVSSSSCDSEITIESSPLIQTESVESSLVIPKTYSVRAEHSYASPPTSVASKSTIGAKGAAGAVKKQKNTSIVRSLEHQKDKITSQKQKIIKDGGTGLSHKAAPKKCSKQNVNEKLKATDQTLIKEDPLQKILENMSKEARQTLSNKSKPVKRSSVCRKSSPITINPSRVIENTNDACEEPSNTANNIDLESKSIISLKNVVPVCEDQTPSDTLSQSKLLDNALISQPLTISNESASDQPTMVQEETVLQPLSPGIISKRPPSICSYQKSITRDDFIEQVKPPMSLSRMMKKERSMLKHGFKQIATVLPQRKEQHRVKEVFNPKISPSAAVNRTSLNILNDVPAPFSTSIIEPESNIIYIELPPSASQRFTALPQLVSSVIPCTSQPYVVYARLVPTVPSANSIQIPVEDSFQIQQHPSDVVSALVNLGSDVRNQSTLSITEEDKLSVQLAPKPAITAQHFSSSTPGNTFNVAKGNFSMSVGNAKSGIGGRPVFARISPKNCGSAVTSLLDSSVTAHSDTSLNSVYSKENLPPLQVFHTFSSEQKNKEKPESTVFEKRRQLESNSLIQENFNLRPNSEENGPLIKSSLAVADLLDAPATSHPDSYLNSETSEESVCSKEDSTPLKVSALPPNDHGNDLKQKSTMLQNSQRLEINGEHETGFDGNGPLLKSSSIVDVLDMSGTSLLDTNLNSQTSGRVLCGKEHVTPVEETALPPKEHGNNLQQESTTLQKSQRLEINNSKLDVFGEHGTVFEANGPLLKSNLIGDLLDASEPSLLDSKLNSLNSERILSGEEDLTPVEETMLPPKELENNLQQENATLQKSQHLEINNSKLDVFGEHGKVFEANGPSLKSSSIGDLLDASEPSLLDSNLNSQNSERILCGKEDLTPVEETTLPPKEDENDLHQESTTLQKSQHFDVDIGGIHRTNFEKIGSSVDSSSASVDFLDPSSSSLPDPNLNLQSFEEIQDLTLDHEIEALISCLDSNIACEETKTQPEDQTVNSKQLTRVDAPLTELLENPENIMIDTIKTNHTIKETDLQFNLALQKPFEVCHMQLCNSTEQDEISLNSFATDENPTNEKRLSQIENVSTSMKEKGTYISHFRADVCASRKLMPEMTLFKRNRFGREGLSLSKSIKTYDCADCTQWFHSRTTLEEHTCLKAIIRRKFTSEQFDQLIDRTEQINCDQVLVQVNEQGEKQLASQEISSALQDLVQVNGKDGDSQLAQSSSQTNMSPYLSYLKMKTTVRHKKFICEKCKTRCKSFSALLEHKSSAHDEKYSVECHICGKNFSRLQQLAVHVAKSHKIRQESNPSMKTSSQSVKQHVKSSLSSRTAVRLAKRYKLHGGLSKAIHKVKHEPSVETALSKAENGPVKEYGAHTNSPLQEIPVGESHSAHSDPSKKSNACNTAADNLPEESVTDNATNLNDDSSRKETSVITGSSNADGRDTQCSICSKYFKGKAGLTSHMVQAHREGASPSNEDDITQCTICKKLFKGKGGLTSHMNQAHRETFKCPLCFRRFCYIQTLKFHLTQQHSSSLNTDAFVIESVKPADHVEFSPSKLLSPGNAEAPFQKNVESLISTSSAESTSKTLELKGTACIMTSDNVLPQERHIKKPKKTKWKFVRDTSPVKTASLEKPAENSSGAPDADSNDNVSPKNSDLKKPKKIKWRIVKDMSPEKALSPERPAKLLRLSDSLEESVPPIVISLSKVKKRRYKCCICKKQYKKHQHLVQHQIGAHKFRSQFQLPLHCENKDKKEEIITAASAEDQHSYTQSATPNQSADTTLDKIDLCIASHENVQSSSEIVASQTEETNNTSASAISDGGERSIEEQTNHLIPPHVLTMEETTSSQCASSIPSDTPKEKEFCSPFQPNAQSGKYECELCQIEFSSKGYLERHNIKSHGAPCEFSCSLCDKIFVDIRSLRFHQKFKHKMNEKRNEGDTTRLLLLSKPKFKRERKCDQCNRKFKREIDLINHKRRGHKTPQCDLCSLQFKTKMLLDAHKFETHSEGTQGEKPDPVTSPNKRNDANQEIGNDLSLQSVNQGSIIDRERKSEDLQEEPGLYKCLDCPLTYKKVFCLKRHRILMHAEQATHNCDVCGKGFSYAHSLKNHMMIHSRNEPKRRSRRSLRSNYLQDHEEEPGPNCEESEVKQDRSSPTTSEKETALPIIPSSETIAENDVSHTSDGNELKENLTKPGNVDKNPDQEIRSSTTSQNEDFQHSPMGPSLPAENISYQETETFAYNDSCVPATCNTANTPNYSVPVENNSSNNYLTIDPVRPNAGIIDSQWRPAPQMPQYQMLHISGPSIPPLSEPQATPSFDQMQAFNRCTLCGLCLPSWYALQEHHYVFHSYPNHYAAPAPSPAPSPYPVAPSPYPAAPTSYPAATSPYPVAPTPYPAAPTPYPVAPTPYPAALPAPYPAPSPYPAAPSPYPAAPSPYPAALEYSALSNPNATYNDWTQQQHQLTSISSSQVFNNGTASFQELTSHSGAHCSVCGLGFSSLHAFQEHYTTHMAVSKPAVQYCGSFY